MSRPSPRARTFSILSLGCSKNQVDSERVNGALASAGLVPVTGDDADIVIINTCGFIEDAKTESIDAIFEAIRSRCGGQKIVVMGCLTQRYLDDMRREIPEIDFIAGIPDDAMVARMLRAIGVRAASAPVYRQCPLVPGEPHAYIKISEGCSNNCSYCAIPLIRGPHVSDTPARIVDEARRAVQRGARELVVVGQDIARYRHGRTRLPELVERMARINGVRWIRLMYLHPDHVDDAIIDLVATNNSVVKYLDIPLQHASDEILRAMGRGGTGARYRELIETLRDRVPGIRIRSTFMVGFPGETDRHFRELVTFVRRVAIDRAGCFVYSPEEGTDAASRRGRVPKAVGRRRFDELMKVQQAISKRRLRAMIGERVEVLVEEHLEGDVWVGRTQYDAPEVDGIFYLTGPGIERHAIVAARVTDATEYDLMGVPL